MRASRRSAVLVGRCEFPEHRQGTAQVGTITESPQGTRRDDPDARRLVPERPAQQLVPSEWRRRRASVSRSRPSTERQRRRRQGLPARVRASRASATLPARPSPGSARAGTLRVVSHFVDAYPAGPAVHLRLRQEAHVADPEHLPVGPDEAPPGSTDARRTGEIVHRIRVGQQIIEPLRGLPLPRKRSAAA